MRSAASGFRWADARCPKRAENGAGNSPAALSERAAGILREFDEADTVRMAPVCQSRQSLFSASCGPTGGRAEPSEGATSAGTCPP